MGDKPLKFAHYSIREWHGDLEIGFPRDNGHFGAEIAVYTGNWHQAQELAHFMGWRLTHPAEKLEQVLPIAC